MEILAGIQDKIQEYDYDLTIYNIKSFTNNDELREQVEYVIKKGLAEGYILISVHLGAIEWEHLRRFKSPIVLVDEYSEHFDSVSVDSVDGAYAATKYLIDQGAKRVAMISAVESSKPVSDRIEGYLKALKEAGLPSNRDLIICGDDPYRDGFTEDAGYRAMVKILEHPLEQPDRGRAVAQDEPVLRRVTHDLLEPKLLVKRPRCGEVFHGQTDRECSEFHVV
jgi:LacI family transcriptional regulator